MKDFHTNQFVLTYNKKPVLRVRPHKLIKWVIGILHEIILSVLAWGMCWALQSNSYDLTSSYERAWLIFISHIPLKYESYSDEA